MENKISKQELQSYLEDGMSSRDIEKITGIKYWDVLSLIKQYNLTKINKYRKVEYNDNYFYKIDTKEKAYILGFLLGDGCISEEGAMIVNVQLQDKKILDFIVSEIGGKVRVNTKLDKRRKIYPNATIKINNNKIIKDLNMLFGGRLKEERRLPRISPNLESYMIQGFFDAEGCITWGIRKDRNRIWQKISFTSQYRMLEGVQNILIKHDIPTKIRPKNNNEKCFVMEICSKDSVNNVLNFIYSDKNFIILKRKYNKSNALRLEWGEIGEA